MKKCINCSGYACCNCGNCETIEVIQEQQEIINENEKPF